MTEQLNSITDFREKRSSPRLEVVFATCVAFSFLVADCLGLLMATKLRLLVPYVLSSPLVLGIGCFIVIRNRQLGRAGALTLCVVYLSIFLGNLAYAAKVIASM